MNYSFKMFRGDTYLSDFLTLYSDDVPEFATQDELLEFEPISLTDKTITGQVRSEADGLKIFDLDIE